MNAALPKSRDWSRGRFLLVTAGLFAGQMGLVFLLADRSRPAPVPAERGAYFRVLPAPLSGEALSKYVFAIDPTVFPFSSPHGFAQQAWLRLPPGEHKLPKLSEPAAFLEFAATPLAAGLPPIEPARPEIPFEIAGREGLSLEAGPAGIGAEAGRQESFFRIEGEIAARQIASPARLDDWTNATLLTNSVVQFAVNRAGLVESARLLSGSGLDSADRRAIAIVSALRFLPAGRRPENLAWDKATFYWNTVAPPGTNAAAGAVPGTSQ